MPAQRSQREAETGNAGDMYPNFIHNNNSERNAQILRFFAERMEKKQKNGKKRKKLELFLPLWYTELDLNDRDLIPNMASLDSPSRRHQEVWLSANRLKVNQF